MTGEAHCVSVPQNCRQTVLTNLGFGRFWQRISELRTFFFMIICIFIDAKYSSKWKYIKYGKNQYIFLWLQPQIAWLRPQIDIDFSIFWPVCHLKFFVLYNLPLSIVIKFGRTVRRQFGKEVPNMFEVRRFGNPQGRSRPNTSLEFAWKE